MIKVACLVGPPVFRRAFYFIYDLRFTPMQHHPALKKSYYNQGDTHKEIVIRKS